MLNRNDDLAAFPSKKKPVTSEIGGTIQYDVFQVSNKRMVPCSANILPCKLVSDFKFKE